MQSYIQCKTWVNMIHSHGDYLYFVNIELAIAFHNVLVAFIDENIDV